MMRVSKLPGSNKRKTLLLERAAVRRCMGCHGPRASSGCTAPLPQHDQHLPDQLGSSTSATTPTRWISSGPHSSSTSNKSLQQVSPPLFGWCGAAEFISDHWRIHLSVLQNAFFVPPEKQIGLRPETPGKALAHLMLYEPPGMGKSIPGLLQWDIGHSDLRNISLFFKNKVVIQKSGKYYVYSKVTFSKVTSSKSDSGSLLTSRVMLKRKVDEEKAAMKAYCNLDTNSGSVSIPRMCTATQGEVIALEKGDKLSVWVEDLSLVDYEDGATSFGMYEL
ncbi:CD40 ligand [Xyrichtys novacula]|uniref:CD40 ligand n=1 Tax=Xyrichtys novacula TaxID=13765 RepID=A0AAV1FDP9_XYRNO|nr:CD40 ligand [Xyrichtys novacula]